MKDPLTHLMNGLHTWSGLLFGWLLFAIFLTGTLTIFDTEITSWMQPESHEITSDTGQISLRAHEDRDVSIGSPFLQLIKLQEKRTFSGQTIDPVTGRMVTFRDTQGGDFFYHFHSGLPLGLPGAWIVGIAGTAMFVALGTGWTTCGHRGIFLGQSLAPDGTPCASTLGGATFVYCMASLLCAQSPAGRSSSAWKEQLYLAPSCWDYCRCSMD